MQTLIRYMLIAYIAATAGLVAMAIGLWASPGVSLDTVFRLGPLTEGVPLLVASSLTWGLVGAVLLIAFLKAINPRNVATVVLAAAVSLNYLVFLRERVGFGDYKDYISAAQNILANEPFHERYVYPPLWASFLAEIYGSMGLSAAVISAFVVNHLSLVAFFLLASDLIRRCGLSQNLASVLVFAAVIVNVPVLRNVVYVQVNFLLIDLILLSAILLPTSAVLSAVSLAIGTHLKVVPILLVPLFLHRRSLRWLGAYSAALGAIGLLTILAHGSSYYFDFVANLGGWRPAPFRSASIYGLLTNTNSVFGVNLPVTTIDTIFRLSLAVSLYALAYVSIRSNCFARSGNPALDRVIDGLVALLFLMMAVSPTVWEHHLIMLIIPAILVFVRLTTPLPAGLFALSYLFVFFAPVVDLYPLSYSRLVGWLLLLGLTAHAILRRTPVAEWLKETDRTLNAAIDRLVRPSRDQARSGTTGT